MLIAVDIVTTENIIKVLRMASDMTPADPYLRALGVFKYER